ncbi:MAG: hypothetical protein Q8M40_01905 [Legionella sp.]|nr:hypothetical protein [Legionella sp.]
MKNLIVCVVALLVLSACSARYSSNGENLYLQSHNGAKVTVPPPLTNANINNFYDLPPQTKDARVNIAPPV